MNLDIFTENSFGKCEQERHTIYNKGFSLNNIENVCKEIEYNFFIPNDLPPNIEYSNKIILLLSNANKLTGEINGLTSFSKDSYLLLDFYLSQEAASSSRLEGTQSTIEDYWIAKTDEKIERISFDVKDIQNYIKALEYGLEEIKKQNKITLELIFEIHKTLFPFLPNLDDRPIGDLANHPNYISDRKQRIKTLENAKFIFPHPKYKRELLSKWIDYFNEKTNEPILIKLAYLHYQFEVIHPFFDGNGRIGRILILLFLYSQKHLDKPLLHLSNYFYINKHEYFERLFNISVNGEWENWLIFFLEGIIDQAEMTIIEAKELISLYDSYIKEITEKKIYSRLVVEIINDLFKNPVFSISKKNREDGYNYNTIKSNVLKLEELGIVTKLKNGKKRGSLYYCADLINIVKQRGIEETDILSFYF